MGIVSITRIFLPASYRYRYLYPRYKEVIEFQTTLPFISKGSVSMSESEALRRRRKSGDRYFAVKGTNSIPQAISIIREYINAKRKSQHDSPQA